MCAVPEHLSPISEKFTIAAAFSNVHGVYKVLTDFQSLRPQWWAMNIRVSQDLRFCVVVVDGDVSGPNPDSAEPAEAPQIRHHVEW